ncbi:MAG: hypothetical protein A2Y54_07425 [Chloroflexi bacterium RBG_16_51_16]|nr:MAG: hypothetical protein A2Y54_07425 [Chloroflexi bacterium RBG_16_51_16]
MSLKSLLLSLALVMLAAGCGPAAEPTLSPADVQSTAIAAAWTLVAATQQAIPTNTPIPPTNTASPTPPATFTPFPTFAPLTPPSPTIAAGDPNNCNKPLNMGEAGPKKRVRIENVSGGTSLNLSLGLWTPNLFGQCGYLSWSGKPGYWKEIIEIPSGSWSAYAWITLKQGSSESSGSFYLGPSKSDDLLRLVIRKDSIALIGP